MSRFRIVKSHLNPLLRVIRVLGLIIFMLGFFVFNYSYTLQDYELSDSMIISHISDIEKQQIFMDENSLRDRIYENSFDFVNELNEVFNRINEQQISKYGISSDEISQIVATNFPELSIEGVNQLFGSSEAGFYKAKTFRDYGSWLEGRTFETESDLKEQVEIVAGNIIKYQIESEKGFDKYQQADLRYQFSKSASGGLVKYDPVIFLFLTYGFCILGALLFLLPKVGEGNPGIKNNGIFFNPMTNRRWLGIVTGTYLILFYIVLYFYPEHMTHWIIMVDPVSDFIKGSEAGEFFLYGFIYTLCILVMGVRMMIKYRHSRYHLIRTASVMFFQTAFAFLIPEILVRLNKPYFDFKNIWPLDYDFFFNTELDKLIDSGALGIFMLGWGIALILVAVPVFVYFFGKRWYCSWVCGCGGLAETLGDPYRQLSDKSVKAWKVERYMIHSVLVFAVFMTAGVLYTYWTGNSQILGLNSYDVRAAYGAWIGAGFAGVVGTGFYPFMGNRVWCRFGCPLAAYLGIVQRFKSRFRITTNGDQCISCGNCSTYCEMGIDVRWYAQRGQNIVRSSCVGCGVCAAVCPRGVLRLENGPEEGRFNEPKAFEITDNGILVNS